MNFKYRINIIHHPLQPHRILVDAPARLGRDYNSWYNRVEAWCLDTFGEKSLDGRWTSGTFVFQFRDKRDAMHFKLVAGDL